MSIRHRRAGRKSWETRKRFSREVGEIFRAIADAPAPEFDTKAMFIERFAKETGKREVITFSKAYVELSDWLGRAFENISDKGFSDMLAETFLSRAQVHTGKAVYTLWNQPEKECEAEAPAIPDLKMAA
jgi:hypothetical protein